MKIKLATFVYTLSLLFILLPKTSFADSYVESGNYWYEVCSSNNESDQTVCISFITGLRYGMQNMANFYSKKYPYCNTGNVTNGQMKDIFVKYLRANPEIRDRDASILFLGTMMGAFPCHK